jgi:predicted dehydrogenase
VNPRDQHAVRIGMVGVGFMGRRHIEFVRQRSDARLVAVADPAARGSFDCPTYGTVTDMLQGQDLDAVVIANPNVLHVDTAIECLEHGLAVLLEKPIATSYAEALRLVAAVDGLGGRLLVGHQRRHHPAVSAARLAIAAGEVGELVAVSGMWSARKGDAYFDETPWHRQPGAGVLLINFVHDLDLLRYLCGEVAEVQAMTSSHARGLEVEDTITVNLRFDNGAIGSFLASDAGVSPWGWDQATEDTPAFPHIPGVAYHIVGTAGALSLPDLAKYGYGHGVTPDWHSPLSRTSLPYRAGMSFQAQLEHFLDVVRGLTRPRVSADDAARTLALVEAAGLAARKGETIDVASFSASHASGS